MKLYNGDCLEVMKLIPDKSIDAIIADIPYGTTACKWDSVIDFKLMWVQLNRIIKPNGAIVLFGSEPFSSALRMSNIKHYKYDWIWIKNRPTGTMLAKRQPMRNAENILVFYKSQPKYNRQMIKRTPEEFKKSYRKNNSESKNGEQMRYTKNPLIRQSEDRQWYKPPIQTLYYNSDSKRNGKSHPTQKPVALMEYLIKTYTNELETVLDFTMGSGSTGVACCNLNRNFIGIELDNDYFKIAEKRIKNEI
jgi:DNA modification methylase